MSKILDVYFHEMLVGKLEHHASDQLTFQYDDDYLNAKNSHAISIALPKQKESHEGNHVKAYFSGLLPEDIARYRLAKFLGISEKNSFSLLEMIGGECAGALSFYPHGKKPPKRSSEDVEIIDDKKLQALLELLKRRPLLAGTDNLRLSLAGAQDKIAVGIRNNKIALIKGSTPTSHILKPVIEGITDSVHNEIFCMHLAKMMKINVPHSEIHWLNGNPYFLIERYDRIKLNNKKIMRLHQEDFCQALGVMPELKYEREGGPGITECLALLEKYSQQPAVDKLEFIRRVIFNYLIGNADAHGKNFSLLYKETMPVLAPAYDLLSTAIYPDLSNKMAMRIGKKYEPDLVFLRHWYQLVPDTIAAKKNMNKSLITMSDECVKHAITLQYELVKTGVSSKIFDDILNIIESRRQHIQIEANF